MPSCGKEQRARRSRLGACMARGRRPAALRASVRYHFKCTMAYSLVAERKCWRAKPQRDPSSSNAWKRL
jgi:hypothetical protein